MKPVKIFIYYNRADEKYKDTLKTHLKIFEREKLITLWDDKGIRAGEEWDKVIKKNLESADIVLFLVSADFIASDYINDVEIKRALIRYEKGQQIIVPILLRPCDFKRLPLSKFQALPDNLKFISTWKDQDEAWNNVTDELRKLVESIQSREETTKVEEPISQERTTILLPEEVKILEERPPWKVLIIDYDVYSRDILAQHFLEQKITCLMANSADGAYAILNADVKLNDIKIVICNNIMFESDKKTLQSKQGYQILKEIYEEFPNYVSLFALTSGKTNPFLNIVKEHQVTIWDYPKDLIINSEENLNYFIKRVLEEGSRIYTLLLYLPMTKVWEAGFGKKIAHSYKHYYRLHRISADFESANRDIDLKSSQYIDEMVMLNRDKNYKVDLPIYELKEELRESYSIEENLERFSVKLIGRRIAIGLFDKFYLDKESVYSALKAQRLHGQVRGSENTINQFFSSYLGLKLGRRLKINPDTLLIEERYWLNRINSTY